MNRDFFQVALPRTGAKRKKNEKKKKKIGGADMQHKSHEHR